MLNKNAFYLGSQVSIYDDFIYFLKNAFCKINIFTNVNDFVKNIESFPSHTSNADVHPIILFIEYPFLNEINNYLNNRLEYSEYILMSFYHEEQRSIGYFDNVFDFVNVIEFNKQFLLNKLKNEINIRENFLSLKYCFSEFYEVDKAISLENNTFNLLETVITSSIRLTSSDAAILYLVIDKNSYNWTTIKDDNYDDKLLKFIISKNMSIDIDLDVHTSTITQDSVLGYSVITGKPIRIDDVCTLNADSEYHYNNYFDLSSGYITKSVLTIPMKNHENNVLGIIQLINKKENPNQKIDYKDPSGMSSIIPYTYMDELIMTLLADRTGIMLENILMYNDMQHLLEGLKNQNMALDTLIQRIQKAQEEERKRIVRELHDVPAQAMANFSFKLELARKYITDNMIEKGLHELDLLAESIDFTSKEIRSILYDMKASNLDNGLAKALENRLRFFEENTGLKVNFMFSGDDSKLEHHIVYSLYRMVVETLTHIHKFAKASMVTVDLRIYETGISIQVTDDGMGFDVKTNADKQKAINAGFGLSLLKERVEFLKGRFDIQSAPGKGTDLIIFIPS